MRRLRCCRELNGDGRWEISRCRERGLLGILRSIFNIIIIFNLKRRLYTRVHIRRFKVRLTVRLLSIIGFNIRRIDVIMIRRVREISLIFRRSMSESKNPTLHVDILILER
jgi:hypothetical protein